MLEQVRQGRWILAAGALLVGGGLVASQLGGDRLPEHPLAVVPEDAELIARFDVQPVMRSHLFEVLLEEDSGQDVRRVEQTCGYDPLEQVDEAVVFAMGGERPFEELGFMARGALARGRSARSRLVECVEDVLADRGGAVSATRVEGLDAVASARGGSVAAFLGADGVIGGDRALVAEMVRAARGQQTSAARGDLRAVYDLLASSHAVLVGRVPEVWLPALMRMASAADPAVGSLLSVSTVGLGARFEGGVELRAVLRSNEDDAGAIETMLTSQRDTLMRDLRVRLSVLGSVLRAARIERSGSDVALRVRASDEQVDALRELLAGLSRDSLETPEPAETEPSETEPTESESMESGEGAAPADAATP